MYLFDELSRGKISKSGSAMRMGDFALRTFNSITKTLIEKFALAATKNMGEQVNKNLGRINSHLLQMSAKLVIKDKELLALNNRNAEEYGGKCCTYDRAERGKPCGGFSKGMYNAVTSDNDNTDDEEPKPTKPKSQKAMLREGSLKARMLEKAIKLPRSRVQKLAKFYAKGWQLGSGAVDPKTGKPKTKLSKTGTSEPISNPSLELTARVQHIVGELMKMTIEACMVTGLTTLNSRHIALVLNCDSALNNVLSTEMQSDYQMIGAGLPDIMKQRESTALILHAPSQKKKPTSRDAEMQMSAYEFDEYEDDADPA
eukprot:6762186-Prymnesium_polylepis.1